MNKLSSIAAAVLATVALAGCGGGGSGSLAFGGGTSGTTGGGTTGSGGTTTYSMGNGSGSSFQAGIIGISSTSVSAGGTTSLQASIVDQTGALYTGGTVTVTFNSTCISQGLATVTASGSSTPGTNPDTVSTSTGAVDATYTAKGCSGSDVITATASVASSSLTATGTVTVASSTTGSIQFDSATPSTIGLKGTGQPATSTVVFKVLDSSGAPKAGVSVSFALNTSVGGLSLSPATASSAADGTVQTVVSSGTVHTPVTVTASIASPALSTQSSVLTVTTGIPASNTFSISVAAAQYGNGATVPACPNVEAYGTDGVIVPVTVSLADRYDNPVLDGTAVSFFTDGGKIVGSCDTSGGTGSCTVNWTSENPRPTPTSAEPSTSLLPGRVVVLATAIGEESFTDTSGSGFYQSGDAFANLGEPYDDSNENGQYDSGEYFLDYQHAGVYQGPPSPAAFVGITCTGTTPSSTCTSNTLAIGASHLIIMSTSEAALSCVSPAGCSSGISVTHGTIVPITFNIQDGNGNPVAAGTSVSVTASSGAGTISSGAAFTVGCSTAQGGGNYTAYLQASTTAGSGTVMIQATSPGTATVSPLLVIPVTVN